MAEDRAVIEVDFPLGMVISEHRPINPTGPSGVCGTTRVSGFAEITCDGCGKRWSVSLVPKWEGVPNGD